MKNLIPERELRKFGFIIGIGFPLIVGWLIPTVWGHIFKEWTLLVSLPFLIIGILKPLLLLYPYKIWIYIGDFLGLINSRLILGFVFLFVLLPISLFMKMFGYDPLKRRKLNLKSYKEDRNDQKIDLTRIF